MKKIHHRSLLITLASTNRISLVPIDKMKSLKISLEFRPLKTKQNWYNWISSLDTRFQQEKGYNWISLLDTRFQQVIYLDIIVGYTLLAGEGYNWISLLDTRFQQVRIYLDIFVGYTLLAGEGYNWIFLLVTRFWQEKDIPAFFYWIHAFSREG